MAEKPDKLDDAYALKTPEDSRRLYADWAASYDAEFAEAPATGCPRRWPPPSPPLAVAARCSTSVPAPGSSPNGCRFVAWARSTAPTSRTRC